MDDVKDMDKDLKSVLKDRTRININQLKTSLVVR